MHESFTYFSLTNDVTCEQNYNRDAPKTKQNKTKCTQNKIALKTHGGKQNKKHPQTASYHFLSVANVTL